MAEFPALPLWTDAYIGDTAHLTNEEHGIYLRLLMFAWRAPDCALPDDDKRLAIMTGTTDKKWRAVRGVIAAFWTIADGRWTQKRLTKERDFVKVKSQKNRDAANARWAEEELPLPESANLGEGKTPKTVAEKYANQNDNALINNELQYSDASLWHMPEPCVTDAPTPTPIQKEERGKPLSSAKAEIADDRFDEFWQQYPHRNGAKKGRASAQKAWGAAIKARASPDHIIGGAMRYASDRQVIQGFAKDPATWLNQKGWQDDIESNDLAPRPNGTDRRGARRPHDSMVAGFAFVADQLSRGQEPH